MTLRGTLRHRVLTLIKTVLRAFLMFCSLYQITAVVININEPLMTSVSTEQSLAPLIYL